MKLKLNAQGFAVVRDGKPVYTHSDGREEAFDAASARQLAKACAKQRDHLDLADVIDLDIERKLLACAV